MEFLLFVQPIGSMLLPIVIIAMSIGTLGALISYPVAASLYHVQTYQDGWRHRCKYEEHEVERRKLASDTARAIGKKFFALLLIGSIILVPVVTASQGWEIFKNVTIYRVVTSDTADKAINNSNLFMDKLYTFIDDWDPKAKVERAEETIERIVQ